MVAQTSYDINQPIAYAGLLFAQAPHDIISRDVEGAAGFAFGVVVSRGADADKQAVLGGTTSILGITVRELTREGAANTGAIKYSEEETAAILRKGDIWAVCPSGCVPGDPVNFTEATGVLDAGAPAGVGETGIDNAEWTTTTAAGELGIIHLESTLSLTAGV